jgi:transcriptional regulator with XRE-family HTH domain
MLRAVADGRDLVEVGVLVADRRGALDMTQQELADSASVDVGTIRNLESGKRWPQARKRAAIEAALRWSSGDLNRLRKGGQVSPVPAEVDIGGGDVVHVGDEEITDPEALRRSLADVLGEEITWDDAFDRLDAINDLHGELRAILRRLRPANNGG